MLKLLRYLEASDFIVYIVSGGGRDFIQGFAHDVYGIPRERVLGSTVTYHFVDNSNGDIEMFKFAEPVVGLS
jgi:hypothetical protein